MTTPKWVHNKIQPIAIRDVLPYLVAAATSGPEITGLGREGPDVLEYGDMMQIYADVAGLHPRRILVLPVLTPRIAALWVGLVTPIPSGLARPLVESLHCDAVMHNHDIDTIIPPPAGGLTPYRRAVELALTRTSAEVNAAGADVAAGLLPNDPEWAGGGLHRHPLPPHSGLAPNGFWRAVEQRAGTRRAGGHSGTRSGPQGAVGQSRAGERWVETTVTPEGAGSRYQQHTTFYPRGLPGGSIGLWRGRFGRYVNGGGNRMEVRSGKSQPTIGR